jgi:hypothetical protein
MIDGSVIYTPMYYNPSASDCLLSLDSICATSNGVFSRWIQTGNNDGNIGLIQFLHPDNSVGISMPLQRKQGLYYTTSTTTAVTSSFVANQSLRDSTPPPVSPTIDNPSVLPPSRVPPINVPTTEFDL